MAEKVQIDTTGIKKVLNDFTPEESISEYIWNGFDAQATEVCVDFEELGGLGALSKIIVKDNGKYYMACSMISTVPSMTPAAHDLDGVYIQPLTWIPANKEIEKLVTRKH